MKVKDYFYVRYLILSGLSLRYAILHLSVPSHGSIGFVVLEEALSTLFEALILIALIVFVATLNHFDTPFVCFDKATAIIV